MTLIEMMVSVGIGTVIIAAAMTLLIFSYNTFTSMANYDTMNYKCRNCVDVMTKDIRNSMTLSSYVSNSAKQQLVFSNLPSSTPATFSYTYVPGSGTLTRSYNGQSGVLLSNITSMSFGFSQRNASNNFTFISTTNPALAKLISFTWVVTKPGFGNSPTVSEDDHSCQIVIRN